MESANAMSLKAANADDEEKIYLTLLNGTGYVFNVDDYMTLRQKYRIMGALVGTSSTKGWSANECTLPVALTVHETRLLVEQGIAVLVSKKTALLKPPLPDELAAYAEQCEERLLAQADALKAEKLREAEKNIEKILNGKRKKLLKKGHIDQAAKLQAADALQEIADSLTFERANALVELPCAHPENHAGEIICLPPDNTLKYRVFRDFWQRGKFVTTGDAFGADFLIYPGDPLLYHASHIVILQDSPTLRPLDLIAKVRLSVTVNKLCVFAYFGPPQANKDEPEVHYQTVQWQGNREKCQLNKQDNS